MGYVIETPLLPHPLVSVQKQKAAMQLRWAGYDALQSGAQLDTVAGRAVYNSYENTARDIEAGKYPKDSKTTIPLPHGAGNITIKRV